MTTFYVGVDGGQRLLRGVDLALADAVDVVEDLALQVRLVDDIHVDDADRADAGSRQVERGRRAEAAGAEQQHPGVEQLQLASEASGEPASTAADSPDTTGLVQAYDVSNLTAHCTGRRGGTMARTMIDVDEEALSAAAERLGTTTKRDTVNEALRRVAWSPTQASAMRAILALATDLGDRDVMENVWQARRQSRARKPR